MADILKQARPLTRFDLLGVGVSAIDMDDACALICDSVAEQKRRYICVCPVGTVMACRRSADVLRSVNCADLVTPDGMPVVWLGRLLGHRNVRRVYGPDLMRKVCEISALKGFRNYFYGSTQDTLNRLKARLSEAYPGLVVSGLHAPPFRKASEEEDRSMMEEINNSNPDIVWVGLGSPKQDLWMHEHRERLNAPVMIGVGAAFDFLAGTKPQAPAWMRKSGLEWLFRLIHEPKRLWRRYLVDNLLFIYYIGLQLAGGKRN